MTKFSSQETKATYAVLQAKRHEILSFEVEAARHREKINRCSGLLEEAMAIHLQATTAMDIILASTAIMPRQPCLRSRLVYEREQQSRLTTIPLLSDKVLKYESKILDAKGIVDELITFTEAKLILRSEIEVSKSKLQIFDKLSEEVDSLLNCHIEILLGCEGIQAYKNTICAIHLSLDQVLRELDVFSEKKSSQAERESTIQSVS